MTVTVPAVWAVRCGLPGKVAAKWASWAVSAYATAELGEEDTAETGWDAGTARPATAAAIQLASNTIPTTTGQRISRGGV